MAKYLVNDSSLTAVADAIRTKGGTSEALSFPDGFVSAVEGIQAGGGGDDLLLMRISDTLTNVDIDMQGLTLLERAFNSCSKLETVKLSNVAINDYGSRYAFLGCSSLKKAEISFVGGSSLPSFTFQDCSQLKEVILECTHLDGSSMFKASALNILVLKANRVVTIGNINAFNSTPFASGGTGGTVYVPSALIEQYQQATNWSTLYAAGTCNFVAIEGSEYE